MTQKGLDITDERLKKARVEFVTEALRQGVDLEQIEKWLNDPACLKIINALCASGKGHKWVSNSSWREY